jgi:1-aminocyclopropane-1-carboxylate deaminase
MNSLHDLINKDKTDYPFQSRVHRLLSFDTPDCLCYVKRDDELGFGITGTKIRKYRSLIPYLLKDRFDEVVVIGGMNSNNVLGLVQLFAENRLKPRLFLLGQPDQPRHAISLLTLLVAGEDSVRWVARSEWPNVDAFAKAYAEEQLAQGRRIFIVPEGSLCDHALPGALTLALDIRRNEEESGHSFDHIFTEAGTGLSAIGLLLGLAYLQATNHVHVLLLADDEKVFQDRLTRFHAAFETVLKVPCPRPHRFTLHHPKVAPSFGSTNAQVFQEIRDAAREEGILLDPIYSAKLFLEARRIIK